MFETQIFWMHSGGPGEQIDSTHPKVTTIYQINN